MICTFSKILLKSGTYSRYILTNEAVHLKKKEIRLDRYSSASLMNPEARMQILGGWKKRFRFLHVEGSSGKDSRFGLGELLASSSQWLLQNGWQRVARIR